MNAALRSAGFSPLQRPSRRGTLAKSTGDKMSKTRVLVGTKKAIAIAVKNDKVAKRFSALAWRLGEIF